MPLLAKNSLTDRTEWEGSLLWQKKTISSHFGHTDSCRHHGTSAQKCWLTVCSDRMNLWCIISGFPQPPPPKKRATFQIFSTLNKCHSTSELGKSNTSILLNVVSPKASFIVTEVSAAVLSSWKYNMLHTQCSLKWSLLFYKLKSHVFFFKLKSAVFFLNWSLLFLKLKSAVF